MLRPRVNSNCTVEQMLNSLVSLIVGVAIFISFVCVMLTLGWAAAVIDRMVNNKRMRNAQSKWKGAYNENRTHEVTREDYRATHDHGRLA